MQLVSVTTVNVSYQIPAQNHKPKYQMTCEVLWSLFWKLFSPLEFKINELNLPWVYLYTLTSFLSAPAQEHAKSPLDLDTTSFSPIS